MSGMESANINSNQFYVLGPDGGRLFGTKWAYAELAKPINYGKGEHCPVCGSPVSMLRWIEPYQVKLSSGKPEKWGDFVWGAGFSLLISERFREIYEREKLTGFDEISPPVEIIRMGRLKSGEFPLGAPVYYHVHVPWGGANQDDRASGLIHKTPQKISCPYCRVGVSGRKQERIVIEEGSWNGADVFKPRNAPVGFLVSERFMKIVETNNLKNVWLIPADKFAYDENRPGLSGLWYVTE